MMFLFSFATTVRADYEMTSFPDIYIDTETNVTNVYQNVTGGNSTNELFIAIDNDTYHKLSSTMNLSNITDPSDCVAGNYVYGKSGSVWLCRLDLAYNASYEWFLNTTIFKTYNGTYDANIDTANTSTEIWIVIDNDTFLKLSTGNLYIGNLTAFTIAELNSKVSDATLLISGGTLTSGKICRYDGTGIDCDIVNRTGEWDIAYILTTNDTFAKDNDTFLKDNGTALISGGTLTSGKLCRYDGTGIDCDIANRTGEWDIAYLERGNSSNDMHAAINNDTYCRLDSTMILSNITDPSDCAANNYVYGKSGSSWQCRADVDTANSTLDVVLALADNFTFSRRDNESYEYTNASWSLGQIDLTECSDCLSGTHIAELSDADISNTLTCSNMEGTDWGTLTDTKWCVYDQAGTEVDCNVEPVIDTANDTEEMQDAAMAAIDDGTQTLITVSYEDASNDMDFVVDNDLHNYDWTNVVDADITNTLTCSVLTDDNTYAKVAGETFTDDVSMGDKNITHVQNITMGANNEAVVYYNGTNLLIVG